MTKEVRIEYKVRNNLILGKMESCGIYSLAELARQIGECNQTLLGKLVAMKLPARKPNGQWRTLVLKLSDFFQCMPEDLFSIEQQTLALETNRAKAEVSFVEMQILTLASHRPDQLVEAAQFKQVLHAVLLHRLNPREHSLLALRFGLNGQEEHTLKEVAEKFGISGPRVREMESTAMRKLRHPAVRRIILTAAGGVKKDYDDPSSRFDDAMLGAIKSP